MDPCLHMLVVVLLHLSLDLHHLQPSSAKNQLGIGRNISSTQTLSSTNGVFDLGFLKVDNSTSKYYLAIWCAGSSPDTAIWVANGDNPVFGDPGEIRLSHTSKLEITDSAGTVIWNSSNSPSNSKNSIVVMHDSGNLQILSGYNLSTVLWQSFEHAVGTLLPGTRIWVNYRAHTALTGRSWSSLVDPSPGKFSASLDPDVFMQVIIKQGNERWWRSNVWSDQPNWCLRALKGSGLCANLSYTMSPEWWNMSINSTYVKDVWVTRLLFNGSANLELWHTTTQSWIHVHTFEAKGCDVYGLCGSYGYCTDSGAGPMCQCLNGFEPKNWSAWKVGDYRGGCVRINKLMCDGSDQFVRSGNMKLPDFNVYWQEVQNGSACADACSGNCSCVAYAYSDLWNGSSFLPRCLVWVGDLIDLVEISNRDTGGGELMAMNLFVRIQNMPDLSKRKKKDKAVVVVLPLVLGISFLVAGVCLVTWRLKKRQGKGHVSSNVNVRDGGGEITDSNGGNQVLPIVDYQLLLSVTNNFSELNKIGQGGFGNVYKGILTGGVEVAIKKLCEESTQGLDEFKNEVQLISKLQHRNLVKLLNCCIHGDEKLLIFEYMSNKSLDLFLFDEERTKQLDWRKRFNIIKGIARGLLYLHEDSCLKIIHRDLKASNVLLDGDMDPKISDFGTARVFRNTQNRANTNRVVGTYGYMSPEYAMEGIFSEKSDVYSFGVLMLEIISGQRNSSFHSSEEYASLLSYAWKSWKEGNFMEMVLPLAIDHHSQLEVERCIHIGLLCVQDDLTDRPNMSTVVYMLEKRSSINNKPKMPTFTGLGGDRDERIGEMHDPNFISKNHLSITVLEGR